MPRGTVTKRGLAACAHLHASGACALGIGKSIPPALSTFSSSVASTATPSDSRSHCNRSQSSWPVLTKRRARQCRTGYPERAMAGRPVRLHPDACVREPSGDLRAERPYSCAGIGFLSSPWRARPDLDACAVARSHGQNSAKSAGVVSAAGRHVGGTSWRYLGAAAWCTGGQEMRVTGGPCVAAAGSCSRTIADFGGGGKRGLGCSSGATEGTGGGGTVTAVGVSGGVDSAVAARLMQRAGRRVVGVFMKNWEEAEETGSQCRYEADRRSAQAVCRKLGVEMLEVDLVREYWQRVFEPFLDRYSRGLTPNPDLDCNRAIKFGPFVDWCVSQGADAVATGHYARVRDGGAAGRQLLRAGKELRDQSYFLASLLAHQLSRVVFPVGDMTKEQVRAMAKEEGLPPADRRNSTGICFVGKRNFANFMQQYVRPVPGAFVDVDTGRVVARCDDILPLTVGQRARISGQPQGYWVAGRDVGRGVVWVCQGSQHRALSSDGCVVRDVSWVSNDEAWRSGAVRSCMLRYRLSHIPCTATVVETEVVPTAFEGEGSRSSGGRPLVANRLHAYDGADRTIGPGQSLVLRFEAPSFAVAPGQAAVLYAREVCLGAGEIAMPLQADMSP